jgi:hypothetical protein
LLSQSINLVSDGITTLSAEYAASELRKQSQQRLSGMVGDGKKQQLTNMEFTSYQIFIMAFFIIVSSIALGTSVFFVKRHFFECDDGDKLLRQKYIRYHEQMSISRHSSGVTHSDSHYKKLIKH